MARPGGHPNGQPEDWRAKLVLHYDGTRFYGWQIQDGKRTVQGELQARLAQILGGARKVTAAGRTDAGAHATGQVASLLVPRKWTPESLRRALNALVPPDLWVARVSAVARDFHPRYDAVARTYVYRVGTDAGARSPFRVFWCWPLCRPLDLEAMRAATRELEGEHCFAAFAKSGQPERGVQCRVFRAEWQESRSEPGTLELTVTADRFLHHMVRYVVGTLAEVGLGHRSVDDVARLLAGQVGVRSSPPAPAQGLFLTGVDYPDSLT